MTVCTQKSVRPALLAAESPCVKMHLKDASKGHHCEGHAWRCCVLGDDCAHDDCSVVKSASCAASVSGGLCCSRRTSHWPGRSSDLLGEVLKSAHFRVTVGHDAVQGVPDWACLRAAPQRSQ